MGRYTETDTLKWQKAEYSGNREGTLTPKESYTWISFTSKKINYLRSIAEAVIACLSFPSWKDLTILIKD